MESFRDYCIRKGNRDQKFLSWVDEIENLVLLTTHHRLLDLPDENYYTFFEEGVYASTVAKNIIREVLSYSQ